MSGLRQMRKTILYLSHGGPNYYDQTRYSVLTLLALLFEHNRNDVCIAVYTDRPDLLPAHDLIRAVRVEPKDFAAWRGPLNYVHRIKLCVLRRALGDLGVKPILAHSEKAAAYMADGYARVAMRPGICMAQSVGAANLASGLQDSYLGHAPVIALTGRKEPLFQHRNSYQEIAHAPLFAAVTKFSAPVDTTSGACAIS